MELPCDQHIKIFMIRSKGKGEAVDDSIDRIGTAMPSSCPGITLSYNTCEIEVEFIVIVETEEE